ncbi:3-hydroxybutyrate dehydrogenase [Pacificoceanicola onchidii]|uniref:3-hydroxybutyrate dehydrogenase n=1 Tax=Pacificoceanicola onchidii TaxID=2562685 RepID=UPI0010A5DEDD|nr:3-hydroxybutyrate dehydrogenase [Pacificoceanicola onchidii]
MSASTAIVTGSTSGIGLAIAETLAEAGYNILLNGFGDPTEITEIAESLRHDYGVEAHHSPADMSVPEEIETMVAEGHARFGSVDVLVNNAGIQHTAAVEEFPRDRWDQILAINLSSNFHAIQAALPIMRAQGAGRIVNVSSVHGHVGSVQKAAYVAAKHGVLGLTKVVALETANSAITCNAVCPGWVRTPLVQKQIDAFAAREQVSEDEAITRMLGEKQPSRNFVTPRQIGQAVLYLCSEAASEIRGSTINVDGGWLAQ